MIKAVVVDVDRILIDGTCIDPLLELRNLREELEKKAAWRARETGKSDLASLMTEFDEELDGKLFGLKVEDLAFAADKVAKKIRFDACRFFQHIGENHEDYMLYFITETPIDILDNTPLRGISTLTLGANTCYAGNFITALRPTHTTQDKIESICRSHDNVLLVASEYNDQLLKHAHGLGVKTYCAYLSERQGCLPDHVNFASGLNFSITGPLSLAIKTFLGPYVVD